MGMVEPRLNDYIRDNLNELKSLFSDKVYNALLKKREIEDREGFKDTLASIIDLDNDFFDEIKSEYSEYLENLSLDETISQLYISISDKFTINEKIIDRAEYW